MFQQFEEMLIYYCYTFSCLLASFMYLAVRRNDAKLKLVIGILAIFASYFLVFESDFLPVSSQCLSLTMPLEISLFALFFSSAKKESIPCKLKKGIGNIKFFVVVCLIVFLQFFECFLMHALPWANSNFDITKVDAVLFTLQTSKEGAWNAVMHTFVPKVLTPSILYIVVLWGVLALVVIIIYVTNKCFTLRFLKWNVYICAVNKKRNILCGGMVILVITSIFAIQAIPPYVPPFVAICKAYTEKKPVVNSVLYEKFYVSADTAKIDFAERKNLVYIMLESMGTDYVNDLPELKKLQDEGLSFVPGGESVATQSITIKSQIAKYCGVPLKFPSLTNIHVFLPNISCIQDILEKQGYHQLFVQGTSKKFSSFGHFLETHSDIETHDVDYYEKAGRTSRVMGSWGIDDFTLFELLKEDLSEISKDSARPFVVYAMSMDTHFPSGYVSEKCGKFINDMEDEKAKYNVVLKCASKNIGGFMEWAKKQEWYQNTVFVIQGDHVPPSHILNLLNKPLDGSYYWYNTFINVPLVNRNRKFSALDMFPTVLEAIGAKIEGHRLGLGSSILSKDSTLLEMLGNYKLDSLLLLNDEMDSYFAGIKISK